MKRYIVIFAAIAVCAVSCLKGKTSWNGPVYADFDSGSYTYLDDKAIFGDEIFFHSYSFAFNELGFQNTNTDDKEFLGGFSLGKVVDTALVSRGDKEFARYTVFDTTKVASISGTTRSNRFAIFTVPEKAQEKDMIFEYAGLGSCNMISCVVANTTVNVARILGYDGDCAFTDGDWLKATFKGVKGGVASEDVDVYLADFRDGKKDVIIGWKEIDLSKVGDIDHMNITVSASREGLIPEFCLDNIYGKVAVEY